MSHARLTTMTMLLVATVGTFAVPRTSAAQDSTATDSAAKDSTASKKKGRFGGFMDRAKDKAKAVANNKTVQGAAKGVACTVVPGAAVATAVTGSGPCVNSGLMNGLISGNIKGAAGAVAAGTASSAAASVAAKALGKGGLVGGATAGIMSNLGGMTGLSQVAAQATALKMLQSAGTSGMSNTAAAAAAMQMMQNNGLSNVAAAAALSGMMKNPAQAGLSASDAAAVMQMLQGMTARPGNPAVAKNNNSAAPTSAAPAANVWVNYDFVPGERVIYYADFTDDQVGNFPARLQFVEGNMEVAELNGRRVLRATSPGKLTIPLPEVLPQRFTIEIDVVNRSSLDGADFHLRGSVGRMDDAKTSIIGWGSDGVALLGGGGGQVNLAGDAMRLRYRGKPAQVRILGDGSYIKVYLDEKKLANVPNANFERSKVLHLSIEGRGEDNAAYISRIRVAESRKSMYDDLAANGHVATQGLLFDTGSDKLRPESTPTLKTIAAMLSQHPELRVRIEGHTDNVGAKNANQSLSEKRAAAVKTSLVNDYKVDKGRLDSKGFGDTKPVGDNATAEGRSNNRRVELVKM